MHSEITGKINIENLLDLAIEAGEAIMDVYRTDFSVEEKSDGSLLTQADQISNHIITDYLKKNYNDPILSEENEDIPYEERKDWQRYWLIDPLDGTREFANKRKEFTVNIALVEDNLPVMGIIYAPVFEDLFFAIRNEGTFLRYKGKTNRLISESTIRFDHGRIVNPEDKHIKIILSRSHNDGFELTKYVDPNRDSIQTIAMGSSLKFCRIAQGKVDVNLRAKPTMEWDTAAAQVILQEAGRKLVKMSDDKPLIYNKADLTNPHFVAY